MSPVRNVLLLAMFGYVSVAVFPARARAGDDPHAAAAQKQPEPIYDEAADAGQQVDAALARARRDNKRVLVQWGANWCGWCRKLHALCKSDKDIAKELFYEYEVVLVDVGRFDKNEELKKRFGTDFGDSGIPFLTVLDADGKAIVQQPTGPLEVADHHDPAKVIAFLKEHAAKPLDAAVLLDAALAKAKSEQKTAFVHFGAPWCPWCRRLDAWVATDDAAKLLAAHTIELKIDIERMTGGDEVMARYRAKADGGIPWFAFLDAGGKVLATSGEGDSNLGFPSTDEEIAAFGKLLATAGFATDESKAIMESLRAFRAAK